MISTEHSQEKREQYQQAFQRSENGGSQGARYIGHKEEMLYPGIFTFYKCPQSKNKQAQASV